MQHCPGEHSTTFGTPKKMKSNSVAAPREKAFKKLRPLIRFCQCNRGGTVLVIRKMSKLTGRQLPRSMVERWLQPQFARWTEPKFGIALLLLNVQDDLKRSS